MTAAAREPDRDWFGRHPLEVAPELLGALLTSTIGGTIVTVRVSEVEAYGGVGEDPGSHAHRRRTARNASMFGTVGHAYVYFTYGMHWCLNVVAHEADTAGAVLIRAGEVVAGAGVARERRPAARSDRDLARGPARLAAALGVTGELDGVDMLAGAGPLRLLVPGSAPDGGRVAGWSAADDPAGPLAEAPTRAHPSGPRVGLSGDGADAPWRFWVAGDPTVSRHQVPRQPR